MKKLIHIFILLCTCIGYTQNGINYKAVIKDAMGNIVANQSITLQFSILQGIAQTNVYTETHNPTTNNNGIAVVNIGEGTSSDDFSAIDWGSDDHFLNVQANIGSGLVDMGTTQFKAVPYALQADNVQWTEANNSHIENTNLGNVGIAQSSPSQKLDVNGKIKINDDNQVATAGTMRFNSTTNDFEGYNGTKWVSLNKGPIAHGFVALDGSIYSGSGNYTVVWDSINEHYEIDIEGEVYNYFSYTTFVFTPNTVPLQIRTSAQNGKLIVAILGQLNNNIQFPFHFKVHK